ncbi:MAG: hypothetical protein Q8M94_04055, partial [Ignavibacteria bacterium]|nr:hypothetical protein [Ignavibacteria bacterium]
IFAIAFMNPKTKKYRSFIYTLTPVFLIFVLFSPFFHHHHADEVIAKVDETIVHSHLLNPISDNHNSEETSHSSSDRANQYVFVKLNTSTANNSPRLLQPSPQNHFCLIQYFFQNNFAKESIQNLAVEPITQLQWEKYVHSAANVSPPLS